ncbi:MAG: iron-containing alcohol dehydrogenase [Candidatus Omnitrophica bacterium]|nr:iron-containing alcohol dehydrogenase [Candidatus Omnitrophota bacterium]
MTQFGKRLCAVLLSLGLCLLFPAIAGSVPSDSLQIDSAKGRIVEQYKGRTNLPFVVLMQDVHAHPEAQRNASEVIAQLYETNGFELVCSEGAAGWIDTSEVSEFPYPQIRQKAADLFLRLGELTGEEYVKITRFPELKIWGIEDPELYFREGRAYLSILYQKEECVSELQRLTGHLLWIGKKVWPRELVELDAVSQNFENSNGGLQPYLRLLLKMAEDQEIRTEERFKQLSLMQEMMLLSDSLPPPEKLKEQVQALSREISASLSQAELKEWLGGCWVSEAQGLDFQKPEALLQLFESPPAKLDGFQKRYGILQSALRYQVLSTQVKVAELNDQLSALQQLVLDGMLVPGPQKQLMEALRQARALRKLLDLELSPEEFSDFLQAEKLQSVRNTKKLMAQFAGPEISPDTEPLDWEVLEESLGDLVSGAKGFYRIALERDAAFLRNIRRQLQQSKADRCIVVTGGFHTPGLVQGLREAEFSFIVVRPVFSPDSDESRYRNLLLGERLPLEQLLRSLENSYRPYLMFVPEAFRERYRLEVFQRTLEALSQTKNEQWVQKVISGESSLHRIRLVLGTMLVLDGIENGRDLREIGGELAGLLGKKTRVGTYRGSLVAGTQGRKQVLVQIDPDGGVSFPDVRTEEVTWIPPNEYFFTRHAANEARLRVAHSLQEREGIRAPDADESERIRGLLSSLTVPEPGSLARPAADPPVVEKALRHFGEWKQSITQASHWSGGNLRIASSAGGSYEPPYREIEFRIMTKPISDPAGLLPGKSRVLSYQEGEKLVVCVCLRNFSEERLGDLAEELASALYLKPIAFQDAENPEVYALMTEGLFGGRLVWPTDPMHGEEPYSWWRAQTLRANGEAAAVPVPPFVWVSDRLIRHLGERAQEEPPEPDGEASLTWVYPMKEILVSGGASAPDQEFFKHWETALGLYAKAFKEFDSQFQEELRQQHIDMERGESRVGIHLAGRTRGSRTPFLLNHIVEEMGGPWRFVPFEMGEYQQHRLPQLLDWMRLRGLSGTVSRPWSVPLSYLVPLDTPWPFSPVSLLYWKQDPLGKLGLVGTNTSAQAVVHEYESVWRPGQTLEDKKVAVIGLGALGQALAVEIAHQKPVQLILVLRPGHESTPRFRMLMTELQKIAQGQERSLIVVRPNGVTEEVPHDFGQAAALEVILLEAWEDESVQASLASAHLIINASGERRPVNSGFSKGLSPDCVVLDAAARNPAVPFLRDAFAEWMASIPPGAEENVPSFCNGTGPMIRSNMEAAELLAGCSIVPRHISSIAESCRQNLELLEALPLLVHDYLERLFTEWRLGMHVGGVFYPTLREMIESHFPPSLAEIALRDMQSRRWDPDSDPRLFLTRSLARRRCGEEASEQDPAELWNRILSMESALPGRGILAVSPELDERVIAEAGEELEVWAAVLENEGSEPLVFAHHNLAGSWQATHMSRRFFWQTEIDGESARVHFFRAVLQVPEAGPEELEEPLQLTYCKVISEISPELNLAIGRRPEPLEWAGSPGDNAIITVIPSTSLVEDRSVAPYLPMAITGEVPAVSRLRVQNYGQIFAVDMGGGSVRLALLPEHLPEAIEVSRVTHDRSSWTTPEEMLKWLGQRIALSLPLEKGLLGSGWEGVGEIIVGFPGLTDRHGKVLNSWHFPEFEGFGLARELEKVIQQEVGWFVPVRVHPDTGLSVKGEYAHGTPEQEFIYFNLGTGASFAVMSRGHVEADAFEDDYFPPVGTKNEGYLQKLRKLLGKRPGMPLNFEDCVANQAQLLRVREEFNRVKALSSQWKTEDLPPSLLSGDYGPHDAEGLPKGILVNTKRRLQQEQSDLIAEQLALQKQIEELEQKAAAFREDSPKASVRGRALELRIEQCRKRESWIKRRIRVLTQLTVRGKKKLITKSQVGPLLAELRMEDIGYAAAEAYEEWVMENGSGGRSLFRMFDQALPLNATPWEADRVAEQVFGGTSNPLALRIVNDMGRDIAPAFLEIAAQHRIPNIRIGGGTAQMGDVLYQAIVTRFPDPVEGREPVHVEFSPLGENRALLGAHEIVQEQEGRFRTNRRFPKRMRHGASAKGNMRQRMERLRSEGNPALVVLSQSALSLLEEVYGPAWVRDYVRNHPVLMVGAMTEEVIPEVMAQLVELTGGEALGGRLPETIVGIGGGSAVDWAKLVADRVVGSELLAFPTSASTNAGYTYKVAMWLSPDDRGRRGKKSLIARSPDTTTFDPDLVYDSRNERANRAGPGDLITLYSGLLDWYMALQLGADLPALGPVDPLTGKPEHYERYLGLLEETQGIWDRLLDRVVPSGNGKSQSMPQEEVADLAVENLMKVSKVVAEMGEIHDDMAGRPHAAAEHQLAFAIETQLPGDVRLYHGEIVALCTVICSLLYKDSMEKGWIGEEAAGLLKQSLGTLIGPDRVKPVMQRLGMPVTPGALAPEDLPESWPGASRLREILINALMEVEPRKGRWSIVDLLQAKRNAGEFTRGDAAAFVDGLFGPEDFIPPHAPGPVVPSGLGADRAGNRALVLDEISAAL